VTTYPALLLGGAQPGGRQHHQHRRPGLQRHRLGLGFTARIEESAREAHAAGASWRGRWRGGCRTAVVDTRRRVREGRAGVDRGVGGADRPTPAPARDGHQPKYLRSGSSRPSVCSRSASTAGSSVPRRACCCLRSSCARTASRWRTPTRPRTSCWGSRMALPPLSFIVLTPIHWLAVVPLGIGCLIGSRLGPVIVRHAPTTPLRPGDRRGRDGAGHQAWTRRLSLRLERGTLAERVVALGHPGAEVDQRGR